MTKQHFDYLDGWRGSAILFVLIGHFGGKGFGWLGTYGVLLFFVLSGRLMSQLLFIKEVPLSTFFVRRFSRVLPTFWFYTAVVFIYAVYIQPQSYQVGIDELIATLTFLRTYLPGETSILEKNWPIGHFWSLNVEEHSYVFLAAGAVFCRRIKSIKVTVFFLGLSVFSALSFSFYYMVAPPSGISPWYTRSEVAAIGILSAATLWYLRVKSDLSWLKQAPSFLPILSFIIGTICCAVYSHKGFDKTVAPFCMAYSVVYLDKIPEMLKKLLSSAPLRWLGMCSFSLYLWQQPFFLATLNGDTNQTLALVLSLAIGTLSFYFFENPIREGLNRAYGEQQSSRSASGVKVHGA